MGGKNKIAEHGLKVFISVDMEGICGVTAWEDVNRDGLDYGHFREQMTLETNAAIQGALEAGAEVITVKDAHDSGRNILPDKLLKPARLIRGWSGSWQSMMEGIDEGYDAAVFIGYHAKAGTPDAILEHTMSSSRISDVSINGISMPEAGLNALIAGVYNVPVAFVAGEKALCAQCTELFGTVEHVAVKYGRGNASVNLHPADTRDRIRISTERALKSLSRFKPYTLPGPYTLTVTYKNEELAADRALFPGVQRTGDYTNTYTSDNITDILKVFHRIH